MMLGYMSLMWTRLTIYARAPPTYDLPATPGGLQAYQEAGALSVQPELPGPSHQSNPGQGADCTLCGL